MYTHPRRYKARLAPFLADTGLIYALIWLMRYHAYIFPFRHPNLFSPATWKVRFAECGYCYISIFPR